MPYRVVLKPSAAKELRGLPLGILKRIDSTLLALQEDPRPPGVVKLGSLDDLYRIRVGDYRIVYRVEDQRLVILVVRIRHRREAYR